MTDESKSKGLIARGTGFEVNKRGTLDALGPPSSEGVERLVSDARTAGARALRAYLTRVVFRRAGEADPVTGQYGPAIEFRIPPEDIQVEWPDGEVAMAFPSIAILAMGQGTYEHPGMGPRVQERLRDGNGDAFTRIATLAETLAIELWATSRAERRCMLAGIEHVMSPVEERVGLHLWTPEHYGVVSRFYFQSRELFDDDNGIRNRRRARIYVAMTVPVLRPVRLPILQPSVGVCLDDT